MLVHWVCGIRKCKNTFFYNKASQDFVFVNQCYLKLKLSLINPPIIVVYKIMTFYPVTLLSVRLLSISVFQ